MRGVFAVSVFAKQRKGNTMPKLSNVSSRYGAPMGRPDQPNEYSGFKAIPDAPHKFTLQRIRVNSGGYDSGGAYWGSGQALYWATNESGAIERFFRAYDRNAAKKSVRAEFPNAKFFR